MDKCKNLGFLFFYEHSDECFITLCEDVTEWDLPFILDHFAARKEYLVDPYWTRRWVALRVVPSDRQNIGAILKEAGLETYDEMKLLIHADGRCAQDDCYIKKVKESDLPENIRERLSHFVTEAVVTENHSILINFQDNTTAVLDLEKCRGRYDWIPRLTQYADMTEQMRVCAGGCGISFGDNRNISCEFLYENSVKLPIDAESIRRLAVESVISTKEAMEILNCTRQNIDDLVRRGRLVPLDVNAQNRMFYKKDVLAL